MEKPCTALFESVYALKFVFKGMTIIPCRLQEHRCKRSIHLLTVASDGDGQPVPHSEHAQIDALVQVQLLIEGVQD